jgi:nonribosomal peptide synthetase MxcG
MAKALREHAQRRPHASALVEGDRVVTYAELERAARACAAELTALGAGPEGLVAFELPAGVAATVVLLGAHLARAGYVALDRGHPRARRERVLGQVVPRVFVHGAAAPDLELSEGTSCLEIGAERVERWLAAEVAFVEPELEPSDIAYVVFTSGSTGEPKGVVIEARALAHFIGAALAAYELRGSDRVLQFAPLTFDASVEELFVTLAAGATLVFRDQAMLDSMQAFLSACRRWEISVLDLPTAFFHELALALAQNDLSLPDGLRLVIIGGEAVLPQRLREWQRRAQGVRLLNTYGPSEATVVVTVAALDEVDPERGVPIGRPLAGVEARLLDAARAPVTRTGEVGEIYLTGPTLARGYFGRDDLTRERFVVLEDGVRAYRTLDLASFSPDGALIYEGRVDDEVKISGHRISPAEIEAALSRHASVTASIVVGRCDDAGNKHLVAGVEGDTSQFDAATLRAFLADLLPAVLVPSVFELTERLPRTPHGKLDRVAFRDSLSLSRAAREEEGSPGEQKVIDAWKQVLGVGHVDLDDNFFMRGGTSLQVIQLANRLSERGAEITVAQIFRHPTPRELARLLSPSQPEGAEDVVALSSVTLPAAWFPPSRARAASGRVLLTGATGFVGLHLLERWLREPGYRVACVVRASDEEAARARLLARASRYGIELDPARIEVLCLDLTGASGSLRELLARTEPCEIVFHAAAEVSLTRDYASLVAPNVLATREAIGLAALWGSSFHHVSTVATVPPAPGHTPEAFFERHPGLSDGYRLSKWHAESLCEEAARLGLRSAVYRLGRISGPRARPIVNPADLIWRIARASTRLGAWPRLDIAEPWMPADTTADILVRLALAGSATSPAGVFHLGQTGSFHLDRVRDALELLGFAVPATDLADWLTQLRTTADDEDRATLAFFELQQAMLTEGLEGAVPELSCARVLELVPDLQVEAIDDALLLAYCERARAQGLLSSKG